MLGGALAVDREQFASRVTAAVEAHPNITVEHRVVTEVPRGADQITVVASGPLTADDLASDIERLCPGRLSFYDAAAPIITAESVDYTKVFGASRYFNRAEYEAFINALVHAEGAVTHDFDVYEGCMPIEKLAKRGADAPRFGPMKPVGLIDPATGHRPWACVQLRRENAGGTLFNLVGFQTNLKFPEQRRVFRMIPEEGAPRLLRRADHRRGGVYGVRHERHFGRAQCSAPGRGQAHRLPERPDHERCFDPLYQRRECEAFSAHGRQFWHFAPHGAENSR